MSNSRQPAGGIGARCMRRVLAIACLVAVMGAAPAQTPPGNMPGAAASVADAPGAAAPAGVTNMQRAWQNWTLNCQGCHRPDGTGSAATAPSLAGTVSRFLTVPGGRE